MRTKLNAILIAISLSTSYVYSQNQPPFASDIQAFERADSAHFPGQGKILFVGSSSFTKWKDVQDYFPGYPIINRGFGGSTLEDIIRYADKIIFPYKPKQVIIYCGDNDIAYADTVSAETVYRRFLTLFTMIRKKMPGENIVFVAIKPSPSRATQRARQDQANQKIKSFLAKQSNASYVDIVHSMVGPDGKPMASIFLSDSLHLNERGYAIWQKAILPYLKK
jgi:lysophospholipase L1-like esterase